MQQMAMKGIYGVPLKMTTPNRDRLLGNSRASEDDSRRIRDLGLISVLLQITTRKAAKRNAT